MYKSGDQVLVKTRTGRTVTQLVGTFQNMQTKARAVVYVETDALDDEGIRVVDLKSLAPYYNAPSAQQRRAAQAVRKYKQGVRVFRLDRPDGKSFYIETLDAERGIAVGRHAKRKTVLVVPTHSLFPELR